MRSDQPAEHVPPAAGLRLGRSRLARARDRLAPIGDHLRGLSGEDWALLLYLGLGCTLFAYIGWTMALRRVDASRAVAYLYGVPPLAVVIGALTLGESVTPWLALGTLLVVGGVAVAQVQR